jgi:HTH-type transcriptional regulator / antitoxin HipB
MQTIRTTTQIGALISSARKHRQLSQAQLAHALGLQQSRLSKLEHNPGSLRVDQLLMLCAELGLQLQLVPQTDPASAPSTSSASTKGLLLRDVAADKTPQW